MLHNKIVEEPISKPFLAFNHHIYRQNYAKMLFFYPPEVNMDSGRDMEGFAAGDTRSRSVAHNRMSTVDILYRAHRKL